MSGGNVDITWTSDERDLIKGQAKLIKQQDQMVAQYKKMLKEAKTMAKQGRTEMEKFAASTTKINRTPAERYQQTMGKLNAALRQGLISQTTFNRAVKQAGVEQKASFGGSALGTFAGYVGAAFTAQKAIQGIVAVMREARAEADTLGQKQRESAGDLAELAQLAETPEQMRALVAQAKKTFAEGGSETLGEAAKLQFRLESAGVGNLRKPFSDLQSSGVVHDVSQLADAAAALDAALGKEETGGFRALVSKAFGASKGAPATVEQILKSAALGGAQARELGISDEQLLAAVSTVAKVSGPDRAATQVQSLLKQIETFGIGEGFLEGGRSLRGQVKAIDALLAGGEDIRDVLGDRQEGITAFRLLSKGMARFDENLRNIENAQQNDAFGKKIAIGRTAVPEVTATQVLKKAKAGEQLSGERIATADTIADALVADMVTALRNSGAGSMRVAMTRGGFGIRRFFRSDDSFNRHFLRRGHGSDETQRMLREAGLTPTDGFEPPGFGQRNLEQIRAEGRTASQLQQAAQSLETAAKNLENATEDISPATNFTGAGQANQAAAGGASETH